MEGKFIRFFSRNRELLFILKSCDCNGFSSTCDVSLNPYKCDCENISFTTGSRVCKANKTENIFYFASLFSAKNANLSITMRNTAHAMRIQITFVKLVIAMEKQIFVNTMNL